MTNVSRLSQVALAGVGGTGPSLVFFPVRLFGRSSLEESLLDPLARAPCMGVDICVGRLKSVH